MPRSTSPAAFEMQKAEPSTSVTLPRDPPVSEALALVVHGCAIEPHGTLDIVRIAQVAPPWYTVPPSGYGGIELVVSLLTDGLVDRGHDVTLLAARGSSTRAKLVAPLDELPDASLLGNTAFESEHALASYLHASEFDVVHDHSGIVGPALGALLRGSPPVVHTLHNAWTEPSRSYYSFLQDKVHLVAVSHAQRAANAGITYAGTVYNGIDLDAYPLREEKDRFLVFVGRANPDKGPTLAIEIARRAGMPLAMIVKRSEPFERSYWDEMVAPALHDEVEVYEQVSHAQKVDLLRRAQAMVFPIHWPEPFGLVMVEAMACGTPVVACPAGAAVELVVDGVTGFLRDSLDGLVEAVGRSPECSPSACRAHVAAHFSANRMVDGYERIYSAVTATP
jgi:glycosyltransferase involved in cell wall biosynthesis